MPVDFKITSSIKAAPSWLDIPPSHSHYYHYSPNSLHHLTSPTLFIMFRTELSDITTLAGFEYLMDKLSLAKQAQDKLDFYAVPNTLIENTLTVNAACPISEAWASAAKDDEVFVPPTRRYVPASGAIGAQAPKKPNQSSTACLLNILHYGTPTSPEQYFSSTVASPSYTPRISSPDVCSGSGSGTVSPADSEASVYSQDDSDESVVTPDESVRPVFDFRITNKPGPLGFSIPQTYNVVS
ncbi:hypothetical protein EXIGLDRAFT_829211 [Exidia glandulosa HHB12029]|uniref:Uncharacterized protein n=1 Tax=Exidia glandulosa HHB12029 TaxID=1314781 RepID=A0A165PUX5_EXIGL|nr:hypothetical protein EXIGLDRAFT_829211 [Exidia glandulosa HHB12029]